MNDEDFMSREPDLANAVNVDSSTIKNENLTDFSTRKNIVQQIISDMVSKEKYTVNLNLTNVDVQVSKLERFVIELMPRLREIGASINITGNNILGAEFLQSNGF